MSEPGVAELDRRELAMTPGRRLNAIGGLVALASLGLSWPRRIDPEGEVALDGLELGLGQAVLLGLIAIGGIAVTLRWAPPRGAWVRIALRNV